MYQINKNTVLTDEYQLDNLKLTIQLRMPKFSQKRNLRTALPKSLWDKIRKEIYHASGNKCSICSYSEGSLEAHEVWEYDTDNYVLILNEIQCLCYNCHALKHYHHTILRAISTKKTFNEDVTDKYIQHFMNVNNCTEEVHKLHLKERKAAEGLNFGDGDVFEKRKAETESEKAEKMLDKKEWKFKVYEAIPFYDDVIKVLEKKNLIHINV